MTSARPSARTLAPALVVVSVLAALPPGAAAPGKEDCPAVIAALLPRNGSIRGGQYTAAGPTGMGGGSADLPFEHPCLASEKFPARISVAVTYYGGEMAQILELQGDAANQQTLQNAEAELARTKRPVKREKLAGGEIVYVDFTSECPAEGAAGRGAVDRPPIPNVRLTGVARTADVRLEVTLEGKISADLAKAAVAEVFANLRKADFAHAR